MESLHDTAAACFMDDLLDFASDIGEVDDDEEHRNMNKSSSKDIPSLNAKGFDSATLRVSETGGPSPDFAEEDLEWLSNIDLFPGVETCFGILPHNSGDLPKQHSPVSVLENSTTSSNSAGSNDGSSSIVMSCCRNVKVPVKARSKVRRRLRQELKEKKVFWWSEENFKKIKTMKVAKTGRQCLHCGSEKTPQWRAGPQGPKTLCNACGVRFKSGRLVPEYRPASSPTFSSELHSNSHRKVLEMRKQKQMTGLILVKPVDKG